MSLNIENERTLALVKELARRTERSQTSAVEEAVAERLAQLGVDADKPARSERLRAAWAVVAGYRADLSAADRTRIRGQDEELYDEMGCLDDRRHLGARGDSHWR